MQSGPTDIWILYQNDVVLISHIKITNVNSGEVIVKMKVKIEACQSRKISVTGVNADL